MSKICTLMGCFWQKCKMFKLRKCQDLCWWHSKSIQNLKENWLMLLKMTWRIWQILTGALQSLKVGTLIGWFFPKQKMYELKTYRGFMSHDNEEWCKIWRFEDILFYCFVSSKLTCRMWRILIRALTNLKDLQFNGLLLTKVYNVSTEKVQKTYV